MNALVGTAFIGENVDSITLDKQLIRSIGSHTVAILSNDREQNVVTYISDRNKDKLGCRVPNLTVIPPMSQILVTVKALGSSLQMVETHCHLMSR